MNLQTEKCILVFSCLLLLVGKSVGQSRCFVCRSRGNLGDCRDPFLSTNRTKLPHGVTASPCASGWCRKKVDGDPNGKDHDLATSRLCMQFPPPDLTERCADALEGNKKIYTCFCNGDLCNSSVKSSPNMISITFFSVVAIVKCIFFR